MQCVDGVGDGVGWFERGIATGVLGGQLHVPYLGRWTISSFLTHRFFSRGQQLREGKE